MKNSMAMITATRYHDISCGHRVAGHESKCAHLHGHNYRIHFVCAAPKLDKLGRVMDFSVIKSKLCMWLEDNWDHKFLVWEHDPLAPQLRELDDTVVLVPFNPTAENMAEYLLNKVAVDELTFDNVQCIRVIVEETRKCTAGASLPPDQIIDEGKFFAQSLQVEFEGRN